ncbi:DUF2523 family protein [Pseudomonas sp. Marseille-Q8238]
MFDWIATYLDQLFSFFQYIWDFITTGVYDFFKDSLVVLTKAALWSWYKIQILALEVAYKAAQEIVSDLGVTQFVRQRYAGIPGNVATTLEFFGVPQALNILFSALSTRFMLRFVPFIGR